MRAYLVSYMLEVSLEGLNLCEHVGELCPDDGLLDQGLAEHLALVSPLEALLDNSPAASD